MLTIQTLVRCLLRRTNLSRPSTMTLSQLDLRIPLPGVCLNTATFVSRKALAAGSSPTEPAASALRLTVLEYPDRLRGPVISRSS